MTGSAPSLAAAPPRLGAQAALGLTAMLALQFLDACIALGRGGAASPGLGAADQEAAGWSLLHLGLGAAALALGIAGGLELWRRTRGAARLGAALLVVSLVALLAAAAAAQVLAGRNVSSAAAFSALSTAPTTGGWLPAIEPVGWLGAAAGLALLAARRRPGRWLAVPLTLLALAAFPVEPVPRLAEALGAPQLGGALRAGAALLFHATAYVALVASALLPEESGWARAADGLQRLARAARAKLGLLAAWLALGGLALAAGGIDDAVEVLVVLAYFLPFVSAALTFAMASGALSAAGLTAARAPRLPLYFAGAALAFTAAIAAAQAWYVYSSLPSSAPEARELPVLVPLVYALGVLALAAGLRRLAEATAPPTAARNGSRFALFLAVLVQAMAMGGQMAGAGAGAGVGGPGLAAGVLASCAEMVVLAQLARLCRPLIPALRGREDVPQAIVVSRPERPERPEQAEQASQAEAR